MSNKHLAVAFLNEVIEGKIAQAYKKYVDPKMKHHNAYYKGDAKSLQKGMQENHDKFPNKAFEIKQVFEDEDRVAVFSHLKFNQDDKGLSVVHIFRFNDNSKIIEMWDVGQPIPQDSPNKNGMF